MDVAHYLGVFLLENELCYLHGIGNLEVRKTPARYDKESESMIPATYDIVFSKTSGSIDDSFPNFIATHERVSISNAANQIKEFVQHSLNTMRDGNQVDLPGLGKFYMDQNQEVQFEKDDKLHIEGKSIPFFKIRESAERKDNTIEQIFENTEIKELKAGEEIVIKPPTLNWSRIVILGLLLLVIVGVIGYFGYKFINKPDDVEPVMQSEQLDEFTMEALPEEDLSAIQEEETTPSASQSDVIYAMLNKYSTEERAQSRSNQLNSFGHKTEVKVLAGGEEYGVVLVMERTGQDEQDIVDSLRVFFGVPVEIVE
ncbi:MAG TPA: hypothetical protein VFD78_03035 [Chitinophagaceae bacterium]|nr:hypothetical protein [Chitinophagaceae bacterium]